MQVHIARSVDTWAPTKEKSRAPFLSQFNQEYRTAISLRTWKSTLTIMSSASSATNAKTTQRNTAPVILHTRRISYSFNSNASMAKEGRTPTLCPSPPLSTSTLIVPRVTEQTQSMSYSPSFPTLEQLAPDTTAVLLRVPISVGISSMIQISLWRRQLRWLIRVTGRVGRRICCSINAYYGRGSRWYVVLAVSNR